LKIVKILLFYFFCFVKIYQATAIATGYVRRKEQSDFTLDIIKAKLEGDQGQNLTERAYSLLAKQMAEMETLQATSSSSSSSQAHVAHQFQTPSTATRTPNEDEFNSDEDDDNNDYTNRHANGSIGDVVEL
jgi:hypothetical protein